MKTWMLQLINAMLPHTAYVKAATEEEAIAWYYATAIRQFKDFGFNLGNYRIVATQVLVSRIRDVPDFIGVESARSAAV